jgi:hypothetical protein
MHVNVPFTGFSVIMLAVFLTFRVTYVTLLQGEVIGRQVGKIR